MTWQTDLSPLGRTAELNAGEQQTVQLSDGSSATVKLVAVEETRDAVRNAVRSALVRLAVNGQPVSLLAGPYRLPVSVAGVQLDCPVTKGYLVSTDGNPWGLGADARIRLWPAGSLWITPGTFAYPVRQRWFASGTQMANEPTFIDGVESPAARSIYYHHGLDFGGAEGLTDVLAASDGLVVSAGKEGLPRHEGYPGRPNYDTVCQLDRRGWYHRYVHLQSIDPAVRPGQVVAMGERVGALGKEGSSGGWSHLHFHMTTRQPSGKWGTEEGYAYVWQAYHAQYAPELVAVARPHHLLWTGQTATLDGSLSRSRGGRPLRCEWTFTDGTRASGKTAQRQYPRAGVYSEILKVTDDQGRVEYDFAVVEVIDREHPDLLPPGIHAAYSPTLGIRCGQPVTFKVRAFDTTHGEEVWDFGDGTPMASTKSDGNMDHYAKEGYGVTEHSFSSPGDYLVSVRRANERGQEAIAHVHVRVAQAARS
jgi:murein DD-endopeptidase MepM/ murein hydrolase activator NlpD